MTPGRAADDRVLAASLGTIRAYADRALDPFREPSLNWGSEWRGVEPEGGPAASVLTDALAFTNPETDAVAHAFARASATRKWEQTYKRGTGAAMDRMLDAYGFAEIVGPWGPFVSTRVRIALALWGRNIVYPAHRHAAEEAYLIVAGGARFTVGDGAEAKTFEAGAGDLVVNPPGIRHGFETARAPVAILAIWLAGNGDLRAPSTVE